MQPLPYRATPSTGDVFDIEFPQHADSGDAVRISRLSWEILASIERALAIGNATSNGDVLQVAAMAAYLGQSMSVTETDGAHIQRRSVG